MSKIFHMTAAMIFAAVAAASLVALAASASVAPAESGQHLDCNNALCLLTIF